MIKEDRRPDSGRQAFTAEMMTFESDMRNFSRFLTRDRGKAEDLFQNTIVKALVNYESFEPGTNMRAWLTTIMRNEFHSSVRSGGRRMKREVEWGPEAENIPAPASSEAEANSDLRRLLLFLTSLSQEQSDALIAVGYLGWDYVTAAQVLGSNVGTLKVRVSRARSTLRQLIDVTEVAGADIGWLKIATKSVPKNHPYYPIAKAYEELYASFHAEEPKGVRESDKLWQALVHSGALDQGDEDVPSFMR